MNTDTKNFFAAFKELEIMPCPVNAGRHVQHDHRYIVTAGSKVDHGGSMPEDWSMEEGSILCTMRDVHPANALLFAAAPDLLRERDELRAALEQMVYLRDASFSASGKKWALAMVSARAVLARCGKGDK